MRNTIRCVWMRTVKLRKLAFITLGPIQKNHFVARFIQKAHLHTKQEEDH